MKIITALLSASVLCLCAFIVAAFVIVHEPNQIRQETTIIVEKGQTAHHIANKLYTENLIFHPLIFKGLVTFKNTAHLLKVGEYQVPARSSTFDIYKILHEGDSIEYSVTIPEGLTIKQVVARLEAHENLSGKITNLPKEGQLLPDTYFYLRGAERQSIIDRMYEAHINFINSVWAEREEGLPFTTVIEALTLASIVEKETAIPSEREMVAGLFVNRLHKNMLLQADPTVVYAVTDQLGHMQGKRLLYEHLEADSPFNTYKYKGLPPHPIANPGRESILATLHPAKHDYIFFVADGKGGHVFAKTLKEHNRNVGEWRSHRRRTGK